MNDFWKRFVLVVGLLLFTIILALTLQGCAYNGHVTVTLWRSNAVMSTNSVIETLMEGGGSADVDGTLY